MVVGGFFSSEQDLIERRNSLREITQGITDTTELTNDDFNDGTFQIKKSGLYVLAEDIVFDPQPQFPIPGDPRYPMGENGPYHLGFFAAITIEAPDVIIDLNGHTISQSESHNLIQRFFSIIELANSPFIPKQGPHSFIDNFKSTERCVIRNGRLGRSSHHGIHGNGATDVLISNLEIADYEVAGIALNGADGAYIDRCVLHAKSSGIQVNSLFSQSVFTRRVLESLGEKESQVYKDLDGDIEKTIAQIQERKSVTTYFANPSGKYDGNMYGIVFNTLGVVVNDFLKSREKLDGNTNILVSDTTIKPFTSKPIEVVAFSADDTDDAELKAYGGKRMVGCFGDVLDCNIIVSSDRRAVPNSLFNAQIYIAEKHPGCGTMNITQGIIDWAKSGDTLYNVVPDMTFVPQGDSMGHFMKGNIGCFVSGGTNVVLSGVSIEGVNNEGTEIGTSHLLRDDQRYFQGANSYGVLSTATKGLVVERTTIGEIKCSHESCEAIKIEKINSN